MKILLINPPGFDTISSCMPKILEEGMEYLPPLGIMFVAGFVMAKSAHHVEILDCQVEGLSYDQIEKEIIIRKPNVVGITAMTFTLVDIIKLAHLVKKIDKRIKVVLGGPHVNIYPDETLSIDAVDFVVLGEGEESFLELINNLKTPDKYRSIKGIVFRENGKIVNTGLRPLLTNLDELPIPARDLVPYKKYTSLLSENAIVTTMFSSRGCPYRCLFCDRPHLGKNFRAHSAEYVVREMEACKKMGIDDIMIYDDTFTVDRKRVIDICNQLIGKNLKINWDVRARVNTVDEELLDLMARAGCKRIHYGVEAGTQKILNVLRKGITIPMVESAFSLSKKANIERLGYFIIGSPEETIGDIKETIKLIKKIAPDFIHVSVMTPFPATDLYAMALREGVIKRDVWRDFAKNPTADFQAPIWDKNFTRDELFTLLKKIYRSFYFRPSYVWQRILKLKSGRELFVKANAAFRLLRV